MEADVISDQGTGGDHLTRASEGSGPLRSIGAGIRAERKRMGWTMAELAERASLTAGAIGMVERGETDPSLNSLRRIADALGMPMFQFLLGEVDRDIVVRRDARVRIAMPAEDIEYELVSSNVAGALEVLSVTLGPGAITRDSPAAHAAEECTIVLRGAVTADIAGVLFELQQGDSVTIAGGLPHRFLNTGSVDADLLMAMSPSSF